MHRSRVRTAPDSHAHSAEATLASFALWRVQLESNQTRNQAALILPLELAGYQIHVATSVAPSLARDGAHKVVKHVKTTSVFFDREFSRGTSHWHPSASRGKR